MEDEVTQLRKENEELRSLVKGYYTQLHVVYGYLKANMTPFWCEQMDKLQERARKLGIKAGMGR